MEQSKIPNFDQLNHNQRRSAVLTLRKKYLYHLQKNNPKIYYKTNKIYKKTESYVHLTHDERKPLVIKFSKIIGSWGYARLFAECVDKIHFDPTRTKQSVEEQAFEQVVSRFEHYLQNISKTKNKLMGMLIHDNNETLSEDCINQLMSLPISIIKNKMSTGYIIFALNKTAQMNRNIFKRISKKIESDLNYKNKNKKTFEKFKKKLSI